MSSLLSRIPFRESRGLVIACAVVFAVFAAVLLRWPRPLRDEHAIAKKQEIVTQMKARGETVPTSALPKIEHYISVWLRKGWVCNTAIAGVILLASPWLGRRRRGDMRFMEAPKRDGLGRAGWVLVVLMMLFAAWQNYPRLFLSMWGDEEFNASRFIVDEVTRDDATDAIKITSRPWLATLWSFRKTTNHLGFTALARLSHDTFFQKKNGPDDPWFSEALIRLPVFIAGLLFLPAMLWCCRVWGLSGWIAVIIAMLHPWFVRFGVDGRAYGLVMLGVPVMLGLLGRGLQTGRWRWWLLLGFAEFFVFWCYFGSLYLLVALNIASLGLIFTGTRDRDARGLLFSRWIIASALAKMLVIALMAPCWPQLLEFLDQKPISGALDWPWWRDSFCEMFFGAPWSATTDSPLLALTGGTKMSLALAAPALIGALLMTPAGALLLLMEKRKRWLLLFALLGPALMLAHMAHSGIRPYSWYLLPYLPGLILIWSAAFPFEENELEQVIIGAIVGVFVLLGGWNARSIYRHHPIEPSRDSVALYRTVTNPRNADIDKDVISGGFIMYTEGYDPALHRFKDAAGLRALMENADRTQRKLFINVGHIEYAREFGYAEVCRIIEDPAQFEHVGHLPGLLFSTTRDVFRYRGKN